jgi:chemotaxis protein MotB
MADNKLAPIIIIKKKKVVHGGHHGGAWKVAYADFVTAMMCFFLVMWLINSSEETKAAIQKYFQSGSLTPINDYPTSPKGGDNLDPFEKRNPAGGRPIDMPAGKTNMATSSEEELQTLKETLEETMSLELGVSNPSEHLEMVYDSKGLILRISTKGYFGHNESEVHPDLLPVLFRIGKVLATSRRQIRIEGDTESTELSSGGAPAWELSTQRAAWVAGYWMKNFPAMKPVRLQVAGNAHFRPIADNSTAEGQIINRRVDIIVLNDEYK